MSSFHLPRTPKIFFLILFAVTLTGCKQNSGTQRAQHEVTRKAQEAQMTLPPSIKASHAYRCEDNSVISIDFLSDDVTINLHSGSATSHLKASGPGEPFTDGSRTVKGNETAVELTQPGKAPQRCKV